jgi:hypothetical protein
VFLFFILLLLSHFLLAETNEGAETPPPSPPPLTPTPPVLVGKKNIFATFATTECSVEYERIFFRNIHAEDFYK